MTLENQMDRFSGDNDRFPVGLRVLAVDDDASCLKLVENLLRKCQYNVTTTNQPMEALKMLRGNEDQFDIVITDVNMPGMDGYKLLELIGLEMDLPVIMLSAHSDTEFVMKGIYHGACDYLVKPCRMAEIKNIWQHVVRKRRMDQKGENNNSNPDERGFVLDENSDNSKAGRKRKEQIEGGEDEGKDDENENEDPLTQKKPRVVWSVELHRKFVAAVTQLTLKKAVPKKILDLMNIEGLTRENVASHLQKYRLYLKRISTAGIQQQNPMHISSIGGFGFSGSRIFSSNPLSPYPLVEVLGKFDSPSGLNLQGIVSPRLIRHSTSRNLNDYFDLLGKFPQSQSPDLFNEIPTSLELTDLHQGKSLYREFNPINTATGFSYALNIPDGKVALNSSIDSISRMPANRMILDGNNHGAITPLKSESFRIDGNVALNLLGHDQSNRNWQQGVHLSKFPSTGLGSSDACYRREIPSNSSRISYRHSPIGFPSTNSIPNPLLDLRGDEQGRGDLIGIVGPTMDFTQKQEWEEHNPIRSAINSRVLADEVMDPLNRRMDQNGIVKVEKFDVSLLIGQSNDDITSFGQHNALENLVGETKMNFNANTILNVGQDGFIPSDIDSLDDVVNVVSKQEPNKPTTIIDGGFWM